MAVNLRLGNVLVTPATVDGASCVFGAQSLIFCRKRWISDSEATTCPLCCQKFNQIRRKHHCRQCGQVLCSKCCDNKILLPQLGYDQEPQKICDQCLPYSQLIAKSRSLQFAKKEEAAKGLNHLCKDSKTLEQLVELGGLQTLIMLSQSIKESIKENVADALHTLATHTVLHPILVKSGALKALCSLLMSDQKAEKTLIDSISAMMIFCKSEEYKKQAVMEGAVKPILNLCGMKETIALLAITTLSLIADHQDNLYALIEKEKDALSTIMNLVNAKDEKMQEIALKILSSLSLGTEWHRHKIVQEHYTSRKCLVTVFSRIPSNQQVLVNGLCLLGNLATSEKDQNVLRECLEAVCNLMRNHKVNTDVQVQISRCVSNFSKYKINTETLIPYIPDVIRLHLKTDHEIISLHGSKTLFNLLRNEEKDVMQHLEKTDYDSLLKALLSCPGINEIILQCLEKNAPESSRPMSL